MKKRAIVSLVLLGFIVLLGTPVYCNSKAAISKADKVVKEFMKNNKVSGLAIAYGEKGKIVWSAGYGYADLEQNVKVNPAVTLFRIGSVSKPITAYGLGVLVENKKLDLDRDVRDYVPYFPKKRYKITTRQLGGHLAGIRHYKGKEFLSSGYYPTVKEGLDIFKDDPLMFEPGTRYSYTSYGWNLISAVMENASGEEFLSFMKEKVFKPLGMKSTFADHITPIIKNRSRYYMLRNGEIVNAPFVDNSYKWAGGGFLSTAEDLIRFGFGHIYPKTVSRKTVVSLWTPQKTSDGKSTNYGIGWNVGRDSKGRVFTGHGGGSVGGTTYFRVYPRKEAVIVVIANMGSLRYKGLAGRVVNIMMEKK